MPLGTPEEEEIVERLLDALHLCREGARQRRAPPTCDWDAVRLALITGERELQRRIRLFPLSLSSPQQAQQQARACEAASGAGGALHIATLALWSIARICRRLSCPTRGSAAGA